MTRTPPSPDVGHETRRGYTANVRAWLRLRGIARLPGVCGPAGEALYPADQVAEALAQPGGRGRWHDDNPERRAAAAREGHQTRRDRAGRDKEN